jgi:2-methylaconitate cis-trans-isomerase PrpF
VSISSVERRSAQLATPAVFMRGGTSKGVFFHDRDLPADPAARERLFLSVIGSPDPYGRQLDGMGGGVSSLSKVVIVSASTRPDADVDYCFGQVAVGQALVDWGSTCGNLASAVGPFAVDEGLVRAHGPEALVRIHAVNTGKIIHARFPMLDGAAGVSGELALPGVAGAGARVRLEFLDLGGGATGRLLPTGAVVDRFDVAGFGQVEASLVDAGTACVFVAASVLGLTGAETPTELDADRRIMDVLETLRCLAGVRMGLGESVKDIGDRSPGSPKVAIVGPPAAAALLDGGRARAEDMDVSVRMLSMGQAHKAVPLTGALCLAVAAGIEGSVVAKVARSRGSEVRVGTPSGVFPVTAEVSKSPDWAARSASVYRTARRLMQGEVLVPREASGPRDLGD